MCTKKVSYSDSLIKFKLMSYLLDSEIKKDILGDDDKSLEHTVRAIEAKDSAKRAKGNLGGRNVEVSRVETKACFSCRGTNSRLHQGGVSEVPCQGQDMPEIWDPGSL